MGGSFRGKHKGKIWEEVRKNIEHTFAVGGGENESWVVKTIVWGGGGFFSPFGCPHKGVCKFEKPPPALMIRIFFFFWWFFCFFGNQRKNACDTALESERGRIPGGSTPGTIAGNWGSGLVSLTRREELKGEGSSDALFSSSEGGQEDRRIMMPPSRKRPEKTGKKKKRKERRFNSGIRPERTRGRIAKRIFRRGGEGGLQERER